MSTSDYELALLLQKEQEQELLYAESHQSPDNSLLQGIASSPTASRKRPYSEFDLDGTQQIVHPLWESLDPTPDIHGMFRGFDTKFFQGKLNCVELEWSKRMYSCAGICYQRKNRFGKACIIRLSEPLLKLRSRKNLVETLLHEMIHAYLFILNVREGNGGHGPNFKRIMTNINRAVGTNITVYHSFHDEVDFYKTHIWRCNGICQHRRPFFGYVRRTANRKPGPNDQWWLQHQEQCGGTFLKVSEPDPVVRNPKEKVKAKTPVNKSGQIDNPRWGMVKKPTPKGTASKVSTIVVRKPVPKTSKQNVPSSSKPLLVNHSAGRNLSNVVGFKDLNGTAANPFTAGRSTLLSPGRALGTSVTSTPKPSTSTGPSTLDPRTNVRDFWSKKYTATTNKDQIQPSTLEPDLKRPCFQLTPVTSNWEMIDDDIQVENVVHETVTILDDTAINAVDSPPRPVPVLDDSAIHLINFTPSPTVTVLDDSDINLIDFSSKPIVKQSSVDEETIKREIIDSFGDDLTDSDIELIDCDYNDSEAATGDGLCDRTITDNLFHWNKSTEDLNKIHMSDAENVGNPDKELVSCPVCNNKCERELMSEHLDGCLGLTRKVDPKKAVKPPLRGTPKISQPKKSSATARRVETDEEREYNRRILSEMAEESRSSRSVNIVAIDNDDASEWSKCPVCTNSVKTSEINDHLDFCLSK